MDWEKWVGRKNVFIMLEDGGIFSKSRVLSYEKPFFSIIDRDGLPAVVNTKIIIKIKEEGNDFKNI